MKTALIAGATGLIGQSLLQVLLNSNTYSKVIAVVRRPLDLKHNKLTEFQTDFNDIVHLNINARVDDVYCCLGTTIKVAGSKDAFTKVDYTYAVQLAQWAKINNCLQYSVVSSIGASSKASSFYLQTKGNMENAICNLKVPTFHIFRPSLLLGERDEFRFGEKLSEKFMFLFNPLLKGKLRKYKAIKASDVAQAMYNKSQLGYKGVFNYEGAEIN